MYENIWCSQEVSLLFIGIKIFGVHKKGGNCASLGTERVPKYLTISQHIHISLLQTILFSNKNSENYYFLSGMKAPVWK